MKKLYKVSLMIGTMLIFAGAAFAKVNSQPPKDVVSIEVARKIATDNVPGQVLKEQLEREDGVWVYSFDLKAMSDSKTHEVQIDARSGKLVSSNAESDDEANEHEDEAHEAD